ncbi:MAG: cbb3-type cytochrome oxidase assembly protein CcoS [Sediminibacterium sp.]|jgi:cbb3-type cytochrome oxidase maturation protein|nr:cbb3-type cytochrome oxidase assembly protein CcoS [Chitinophagaceae bacterium]MCA6446829.1 cbb3-type cytochrome oxidase assembly protein CcoS [Chitinophagaceae bacterium]
MIVILILLCISLLVAICFLIAFVWSVNTGQFDDSYSPSRKILFDNPITEKDKA